MIEFFKLSVKKLSSKLLLKFLTWIKSCLIISFLVHLFNIFRLFSLFFLSSFSIITNLDIFLFVGGTELTRLLVYVFFGLVRSSFVKPISTTLPLFITATLSAVSAITPMS